MHTGSARVRRCTQEAQKVGCDRGRRDKGRSDKDNKGKAHDRRRELEGAQRKNSAKRNTR